MEKVNEQKSPKGIYYSKEILDALEIAYKPEDLEYRESLGWCMKIGEIPPNYDSMYEKMRKSCENKKNRCS